MYYLSFQMEATIKQAEEERNRSLEGAKHLYEEYKMLKDQVDAMRSMVGLERLPELQDEEHKLTPESVSHFLPLIAIITLALIFRILQRN